MGDPTVPLNVAAVGSMSETFEHRYDWHDLVLYALSVGANVEEDLDLLYERRGPIALPSFAVVPAFRAVRALQRQMGGRPEGLLHLGQSISLHAPLAASGHLR